MNRRCKSAFDRPVKAIQSSPQGIGAQVAFDCPVGQAHGPVVKCNHHVTTAITCLHRWRSPAAVFLAVSLIIVLALNAMASTWPWSHVFKKECERLAPTIADRYSSTAVSMVSRVILVVTATNEALPRLVFRCFPTAMRSMTFCGNGTAETSAAFRLAANKVSTKCKMTLPALTYAQPPAFAIDSAHVGYDLKLSKYFAAQVFDVEWQCARMRFSHDDAPNIRLVRDATWVTDPVAFRHLYQNQLAV